MVDKTIDSTHDVHRQGLGTECRSKQRDPSQKRRDQRTKDRRSPDETDPRHDCRLARINEARERVCAQGENEIGEEKSHLLATLKGYCGVLINGVNDCSVQCDRTMKPFFVLFVFGCSATSVEGREAKTA